MSNEYLFYHLNSNERLNIFKGRETKTMIKSIALIVLLSVLSACSQKAVVLESPSQSNTAINQELDGPDTRLNTNVDIDTESAQEEAVLQAQDISSEQDGDDEQLTTFLLSDQEIERYRVGPGDTLNISVFRVDELTKSYSVSANGQILLPLLGLINIQGLRLDQVEDLLEQELGKELLNDPQVTAVIESYRPRNVTLVGAVKSPGLYQLSGNANLYELLSQAGGISKEAGDYLYIRTTQKNEQNDTLRPIVLSVLVSDIYDPLSNKAFQVQQRLKQLVLNDSDWVAVEEAGSVFVDGRIKSPGKYGIAGDLTMLQLLASTGGPTFSGSPRKIRVVRKLPDGSRKVLRVNAQKIRALKVPDFKFEKGDIVTIGTNYVALVWETIFNYVVRIYYLFLVL